MDFVNFFENFWATLLTAACGLGAVYLLLPRPKRYPLLWGASAAAVAVLLTGLLVVGIVELTIETLLFYLFSAVAVVSGGVLITNRNPSRAALSFTLVVTSVCGLFLLLAAPFLAAATIIVYAGAIIVTFLFVIMLAQQTGSTDADSRSREPALATVTGFVLLVTLLVVIKMTYEKTPAETPKVTYEEMRDWAAKTRRAGAQLRRLRDYQGADRAQRTQELVAAQQEQLRELKDWWNDKWESKDDNGRRLGLPDGAIPLDAALFAAQGSLADPDELDLADVESKLKRVQELIDAQEHAALLAQYPGHPMQLRPSVKKVLPATTVRSGDVRVDEKGRLYRVDHPQALSEMSGPASSRSPGEIRRGERQQPHLPAQNTEYVGRSLFSDYLLAIELGGLLLLVATVGAIVIAMRRPHEDAVEESTSSGEAT